MEEILSELVDVIRTSNSTVDWSSIVSAVASCISLTAIIILLIERGEKNRPYLQATFELVKSNLVCIVIRNVGEVPAKLNAIYFNQEFIKQLSNDSQQRLSDRDNLKLLIYPNQKWVISLNIPSYDIFKFENRTLEITMDYAGHNKRQKHYREKSQIFFDDYTQFLVYISEVDELRQELKNTNAVIKSLERQVVKTFHIEQSPVEVTTYADLKSEISHCVISDAKANDDEATI